MREIEKQTFIGSRQNNEDTKEGEWNRDDVKIY